MNVKRTTGIPTNELVETTPDDPQAMLTAQGTYVVPIMHKYTIYMLMFHIKYIYNNLLILDKPNWSVRKKSRHFGKTKKLVARVPLHLRVVDRVPLIVALQPQPAPIMYHRNCCANCATVSSGMPFSSNAVAWVFVTNAFAVVCWVNRALFLVYMKPVGWFQTPTVTSVHSVKHCTSTRIPCCPMHNWGKL